MNMERIGSRLEKRQKRYLARERNRKRDLRDRNIETGRRGSDI